MKVCATISLLHTDDYGIAAQTQHQAFPLGPEMHDDAALVLKPKIAGAPSTPITKP